MPLIIDGGQNHRRKPHRAAEAHATGRRDGAPIRIALINNMPDPALEQTESQFFDLLSGAAGNLPVSVKLYTLPGIPRGKKVEAHVRTFYASIDDLWQSRFEAAIVTGTEPHQANLRNEPYWGVLTKVFDWAAENTCSTVLSCLAAHASVLHSDGIDRHPMAEKRVGVFEADRVCEHALMNGVARKIHFPHSRWNEVREAALTSSGYTVITRSERAGVDSFIKQRNQSLFLHFQGHPEYGAQTLLKEYRRDIKRFLRGEREDYPAMPHAYFNASATKRLADFREKAMLRRREELLESFPEATISQTLERTWDSAASTIYRNWLGYVALARNTGARIALPARLRRAAAYASTSQQKQSLAP
jgi:homoserine O-succinyltransferase